MTNLHAKRLEDRLGFAHLYLIAGAPVPSTTASASVAEESWLDRVRAAVRGGVGVVQLRAKGMPTADVVRLARKLKATLDGSNVPLIVNDDLEAARAADADGVHLGQDDATIAEARRILGPERLVGISTHSLAQASAAERGGADYIGCGAAFATSTKDVIELIGPRAIGDVVAASRLPVFAIGGIKLENLAELRANGIDRVAVSSALMEVVDPERAASEFCAALGSRSGAGG